MLKKLRTIVLCLALVIACIFVENPINATAAGNPYKCVFDNVYPFEHVTVYGYDFYFDASPYVYMRKTTDSSSAYKKFSIGEANAGDVYFNGTNVVFLKIYKSGGKTYRQLCKFNYTTGAATVYKNLPAKKATDRYKIACMHGSQIYLTYMSWNSAGYLDVQHTYMYNLKTKKCVLTQKNTQIITFTSRYAACESRGYIRVFKYTNSGLKQTKAVCKLTNSNNVLTYAGRKLYFCKVNKAATKLSIYRCSENGSNLKRLRTFRGQSLYVQEFRSKYCILSMNSYMYKYTYKTNKLRKL